MFRDAYSSKDRTLRLLAENPMAKVPWPERGQGAALKQLLYPAEFLALVSCPKVPIVRARLYAVTLYTMTRAAEVRVLECQRVDVAFGNVKILKSDDPTKHARATKLTKSGKARLVSLEPTLAPVIHQMIVERGGKGRLFVERPDNLPQANQWRRPSEEFIPGPDGEYGLCGTFKRDLRAALEWAGITERPELFDDSDRRASISIRFHDLRASGITWRHARRDNPAVIRQECGHEDQATNEIDIRTLRNLAPADLFPALPDRLLGEAYPANNPAKNLWVIGTPILTWKMVGAEGLEKATRAGETPGKAADGREGLTGLETAGDGSQKPWVDADEALKEAIVAAVRAGKYERAVRLLDVLRTAETFEFNLRRPTASS